MDSISETLRVLNVTFDQISSLFDNLDEDSLPKEPGSANTRPKNQDRGPESRYRRMQSALTRMMEKMVKKARCNTIKLDFSSREAATQQVSADEPIPASWINWDHVPGDTPEPRMAVDKDNIPLVLWLPQFLADSSHKHLLEVLTEFGRSVETALSLGSGADSCGRNKRQAYRFSKGEISGCINIALWHAIGHENTPAILSRGQLGSSARFSSCEQFIYDLSLASHRINEVLRFLDPAAHESHKALREKLIATYAHAKSRAAINPLLFQGQSVIFNRQTPNHVDRRDPIFGWTPLFTAGIFAGGYLRIRRLRLRMWFGPGACIFLRGAMCPHEIEPFDGGQRISIAHFCHESVWKEMEVEYQSEGV